ESRLTRHRRELKADLVAFDVPELDRQQIEINRAIGLGGQVQKFADCRRVEPVVEDLEVCRLASQSRTVVDDLGSQLACTSVVNNHSFLGNCNPGLGP